jgi:hypothetical protein
MNRRCLCNLESCFALNQVVIGGAAEPASLGFSPASHLHFHSQSLHYSTSQYLYCTQDKLLLDCVTQPWVYDYFQFIIRSPFLATSFYLLYIVLVAPFHSDCAIANASCK